MYNLVGLHKAFREDTICSNLQRRSTEENLIFNVIGKNFTL